VNPVEKPDAVVVFDFDGTLTHRDTLFPFLLHLKGVRDLVWTALPSLPMLAGYACGLIDNGDAKERLLGRMLGGMSHETLQELGNRFAREHVPGLLRPEAMQAFSDHRRSGHRCVVVSASLDVYVSPWASHAGFDDVICSRLEQTPAGKVTGRLVDGNCYGPEKLRRLRALLGPRADYRLIAYGDSRGDIEMLNDADEAYFRFRPWRH
jgi:HAD superfamily hydrolase (TIGR01490 family)